jgi:serine/threonine-protein kinase HipA
MKRKGRVYLDQDQVGRIEETDDGMKFSYDRDWLVNPRARPISLTLPLQEEPFVSRGLHPFFENLLPEGWLLDIALAELKLSRGDAFGLLLNLCRDCVGAVGIEPLEQGQEEAVEEALVEASLVKEDSDA